VFFRGVQDSQHERVISLRHNDVEISGVAPRPITAIQLQREPVEVTRSGNTGYRIEAVRAGKYELKTSAGRKPNGEIPEMPEPFEIKGPWELDFPKGWKAPERVTLERLISWTDHPHPGVKYFSGTATYHKRFQLPSGFAADDRGFHLDLGNEAVIAEAKLNGHDLGILWKPPFRVDITKILRAGANELTVDVVNLWPNRLIGDDMLPPDCEWIPPQTSGNPLPITHGSILARWPEWILENKPSPTGHVTFATWKHWSKDDPLLISGLLGPVRIIPAVRRTVM